MVVPSSDYGPCDACAVGEQPLQLEEVDGCFCGPQCDDMNCPAASEGTALAQCAAGGDMGAMFCVLVCDPAMMGMCPTGMVCDDVPAAGEGVGVCTFPP